jgi:putative transcriptional regulator
MKPSVAERMKSRLQEFAEALESGGDISDQYTCRKVVLNLQPTPYNPELVKQTRALLGLSQHLFAKFLGVSLNTVQAWERGDNPPKDMACRFMDEIRNDPEYWRNRLAKVITAKPESKLLRKAKQTQP